MTNRFQHVPASSIRIGPRIREDLGDLNGLAISIAELGLLQPLVVRSDMTLVAGMRRYVAMTEHLGWTELPAYVVDDLEDEHRALRAELHENSMRLDLSPLEAVIRGAEIESREKAAAEERRRGTQFGSVRPTNPDRDDRGEENVDRSGPDRAIDRVAASVGMGRTSYVRAREIVAAAEAEPEKYSDITMELHNSRNVNGTYKHFKARQAEYQRHELAQAPPEERPAVEQVDPAEWLSRQGPCDLLIANPPPVASRGYDYARSFAEGWVPQALRVVRSTGRTYIFVSNRPEELLAYLEVVREHLDAGQILGNVLAWSWRNVVGQPPVHDYRDNWVALLHVRGRHAPALTCPTMAEQFGAQDLAAPENELVLGREKPFELMSRLVSHATQPGGRVLVPWCGSGEAVLAAHALGRDVEGCEPDEELLRRAVERGCRVVGE